MKILFSGGGTLGPVTPLIAMHETISFAYPEASFVWVGTGDGPERRLVDQAGIPFFEIASGKFRRYISFWNIFDFIRLCRGFIAALFLLTRERPNLCISAGGFVSVPVHWAAWMLGIPTWIHQQDVHVGLANRLMAPIANSITTALEASVSYFSKKKTTWIGNPVRKEIFLGDAALGRKMFGLTKDVPVILVTGGGTGSHRVNEMIVETMEKISDTAQVIHLTGLERSQELAERAEKHFSNYHVYRFFTTEMKDAYAVADIVISRGGFGTIAELAALGKAAILIPKPGHQEENVQFLEQAGAAVFVNETLSDGFLLAREIADLLDHPEKRKGLGEKLKEVLPVAGDERILEIVKKLVK